jgi:parallel beta-helix repeat protein
MQARIFSLLALTTSLFFNPQHFAQTTFGATFYLSSTGNDSNTGRAIDQPWRSLARLQAEINAGNVQAGDQVLFARGSTFAGGLALSAALQGTAAAPVTFGSYGSGNRPVLSGLVALGNWQSLGNNRWRTTCDSCSAIPTFLLIGGEPQQIARWPNLDEGDGGYRYYSSFSGRTSITDPALPASINWVGGEVVLRSIAWVLDRLPIASQSGSTLTFGTPATYDIEAGYGYFIQNHLSALNRDGEWVYDAANKTVTLQWSSNPNGQSIEVPTTNRLIEIRGSDHVVFHELELRGAAQDAINTDACAGIAFDEVIVRYAGEAFLNTGSCSEVTLTNSTLRDSMNVGLRMSPCANCRVSNTLLERIGMFAGLGGNGDGHYFGAILGGANFVIEQSTMRDVGYVGISFYGAGTVRNNIVSNFNLVKTDGAGIYTYRQSDVVIANNLVRDGTGSRAGTPWSGTGTNGIYIDDDSQRVTVQGNTVLNISGAGIYLHNTRNVTVTDNLIYNSGEAGLQMIDDSLGTFGLENSLIRQNQIVGHNTPAVYVRSSQTANLFSSLGTVENNQYCDPFGDVTFLVELPGTARTKTLAQWRADHGRDLASTQCADRYAARSISGTPGPNRVSNGTFDTNLAGWFGWPSDTLDARHETGRLDGGSLRLGYNGPSNVVHYDIGIGNVQSGQTFRLRVDGLSAAGTPGLTAYLRQAGEPYLRLGQTVPLLVDGSRRAFEVFFDVPDNEADALLIFELNTPGTAVGLDNVQLQQVTAVTQSLGAVSRPETNPSTQPRTFALDGYVYRGIDGTTYAAGSTITLTPFQSIVLLRGNASSSTATPTPVPTPNPTQQPTQAPTQTPAAQKAKLTIKLDAQPDSRQNFRFGGSLPMFYLDDIAPQDRDTYTNTAYFSLNPGTYVITQALVSSWYLTDASCTSRDGQTSAVANGVRVSVDAGSDVVCTFTNRRGVSVRAQVFDDVNGSGAKSVSEPWLSGWQVFAYAPSGNTLGVLNSDTNGRALFGYLPGPDVVVCETLQAGWRNTRPATLDAQFSKPCHRQSLLPNQLVTLHFGNQRQTTLYPEHTTDSSENGFVDGAKEMLPDVEFDEAGNVASVTFQRLMFLPVLTK